MAANNYTPLNTPTVSFHKEAEPVQIALEKNGHVNEVVEHEQSNETKPFVTPHAESIQLPPDLKKLGLQASSSSQFPGYQKVTIPLADDKVLPGLHAPITSSLRWLATLAFYLLKKAHLTLKMVGGKTIRVLQK